MAMPPQINKTLTKRPGMRAAPLLPWVLRIQALAVIVHTESGILGVVPYPDNTEVDPDRLDDLDAIELNEARLAGCRRGPRMEPQPGHRRAIQSQAVRASLSATRSAPPGLAAWPPSPESRTAATPDTAWEPCASAAVKPRRRIFERIAGVRCSSSQNPTSRRTFP